MFIGFVWLIAIAGSEVSATAQSLCADLYSQAERCCQNPLSCLDESERHLARQSASVPDGLAMGCQQLAEGARRQLDLGERVHARCDRLRKQCLRQCSDQPGQVQACAELRLALADVEGVEEHLASAVACVAGVVSALETKDRATRSHVSALISEVETQTTPAVTDATDLAVTVSDRSSEGSALPQARINLPEIRAVSSDAKTIAAQSDGLMPLARIPNNSGGNLPQATGTGGREVATTAVAETSKVRRLEVGLLSGVPASAENVDPKGEAIRDLRGPQSLSRYLPGGPDYRRVHWAGLALHANRLNPKHERIWDAITRRFREHCRTGRLWRCEP